MGAIDFAEGVLKTFIPSRASEPWKVIGSVPNELHSVMLGYCFRVCAGEADNVYVVNTRDMILYCLDVANKQWGKGIQVNTSYRLRAAAMSYCKGRLYICGGCSLNRKKPYRTMLSLVVKRGSMPRVPLQQEPKMIYARYEHQMACVNGNLLVCGGRNVQNMLATCERFCPSTRRWEQFTQSPEALSSTGLVPTNDGLYVLGGVTGYNSILGTCHLSDTVSLYDRQARKWNSVTQLPRPLAHVQAIYKGGSLWVLAACTKICKPAPSNPETICINNARNILEYHVNLHTWFSHDDAADVGSSGNEVFLFSI